MIKKDSILRMTAQFCRDFEVGIPLPNGMRGVTPEELKLVYSTCRWVSLSAEDRRDKALRRISSYKLFRKLRHYRGTNRLEKRLGIRVTDPDNLRDEYAHTFELIHPNHDTI